ncbi:Tetratricopeptide-like helical domain containing protein [Dorcoceras hygrometricum]|uniref:Tetratricopeptide-like helical domain containing protein n=1 Tax=Dorcoceras hygrometricum TaxID=472368 RepID=A0A2Z6ZTB5_9LAMI|nr:Tetratricopeptide-like helical domain containing protein [Dorcoceras hygrometricum]
MAGYLGCSPCARCCALVGDRRHAVGSLVADCWVLRAYGCARDVQPMAGQWPAATGKSCATSGANLLRYMLRKSQQRAAMRRTLSWRRPPSDVAPADFVTAGLFSRV